MSDKRKEDFPVESLRHLENRIAEIRRDVMCIAARLADEATNQDATVYRVKPCHIDAAFQEFMSLQREDEPEPDEITSDETICVSTADAEWAIRKFVKPNTMRAIIDRLKKRSKGITNDARRR